MFFPSRRSVTQAFGHSGGVFDSLPSSPISKLKATSTNPDRSSLSAKPPGYSPFYGRIRKCNASGRPPRRMRHQRLPHLPEKLPRIGLRSHSEVAEPTENLHLNRLWLTLKNSRTSCSAANLISLGNFSIVTLISTLFQERHCLHKPRPNNPASYYAPHGMEKSSD